MRLFTPQLCKNKVRQVSPANTRTFVDASPGAAGSWLSQAYVVSGSAAPCGIPADGKRSLTGTGAGGDFKMGDRASKGIKKTATEAVFSETDYASSSCFFII